MFIFDFLASRYFFNIILVLIYFLQTYFCTYFFHTLSLYLFLFQITLCTCFLFALLIFLCCFHNILLFYLVLFLCFLDNKLLHYFFLYNEKYIYCIIFAYIPKVNSIIISFNRRNSIIIKIHSFFH